MSNLSLKQERRRARVWSIRKDSGRLRLRLTTPVHAGAFLMRRIWRGECTVQARTGLELTLHRLANYVECQLSAIFQELLADGRISAVSSIAWGGARFVESLREARDGKEGGDE